MTKEEIKTNAAELADSAWESGFAKVVAATTKTYKQKLAEKQKALDKALKAAAEAYEKGFKDGHTAALKDAGLPNLKNVED